MKARLVLIAAMLVSSSAYAADAPKPAPQAAVEPAKALAEVMLASADRVTRPAAAREASAPANRPKGRVSTCRCGAPTDEAEEEEE